MPKLTTATSDARLRSGDAATAMLRRRATSAPRIGCPMPAVPRQLAATTPDESSAHAPGAVHIGV